MNRTICRSVVAIVAVATQLPTICSTPVSAQTQLVTSGANMDIDFNEEIDVPYSGFVLAYFLDVNLIHNPSAGPMFKNFQSPITDTGDRIVLDALQPFPQPVTENFFLIPTLAPILTSPVSDWHEEVVTQGWEWVLPGDSRFPDLFPSGQSLITKNGNPHPWRFPPMPAVHEPNKLWVEFPQIEEGNTLDIHKALLWVGTQDNRLWGDDTLDNGTFFDESVIRVREYPTIPEPGAIWLFAVAAVFTFFASKRRPSP